MRITILVSLFAAAFGPSANAGLTLPRSLFPAAAWPGGVVPYVLERSLDDDVKTVEAAFAYYETHTGVRFVPRDAETDYVMITSSHSSSSFSDVGRLGGKQWVHLVRGCALDTVLHELGHTLGLYHEQARRDRDEHVKVIFKNIPKDAQGEFERDPDGVLLGSYDLHSIMHYGPYDFSKNGEPTITLPEGGTQGIGEGEGLSPGDRLAIAWLVAPHFANPKGDAHEIAEAPVRRRSVP